MFENIGIFKLAERAMQHASQRQTVTAANIANSDTPGFTAHSVARFSDHLEQGRFAIKATRDSHLPFSSSQPVSAKIVDTGQAVDLETQMLDAAQIAQDHRRALSIYKSTLGLMKTSLGKM